MTLKNAFYAQSGGVTAVINASAAGVIETARKYPKKIGKVFAGKNGILGALEENLIDTSLETDKQISLLKYTPGGAFGSARYKLKGLRENQREYKNGWLMWKEMVASRTSSYSRETRTSVGDEAYR